MLLRYFHAGPSHCTTVLPPGTLISPTSIRLLVPATTQLYVPSDQPSCTRYRAQYRTIGSAPLHALGMAFVTRQGLLLRGNSLTCRWHPSALLSQLSRSCMFPRISPLALTNMHIDEQLDPFFCMGLEWPFSKRLIILVVRLAFWLALHHWRP